MEKARYNSILFYYEDSQATLNKGTEMINVRVVSQKEETWVLNDMFGLGRCRVDHHHFTKFSTIESTTTN